MGHRETLHQNLVGGPSHQNVTIGMEICLAQPAQEEAWGTRVPIVVWDLTYTLPTSSSDRRISTIMAGPLERCNLLRIVTLMLRIATISLIEDGCGLSRSGPLPGMLQTGSVCLALPPGTLVNIHCAKCLRGSRPHCVVYSHQPDDFVALVPPIRRFLFWLKVKAFANSYRR
jgi:hypothetical protein